MRRLGVLLLAGGFAGFLVTSSHLLPRYASVEKPTESIESTLEKVRLAREEALEMARWFFAGLGVIGIALIVLRNRKM